MLQSPLQLLAERERLAHEMTTCFGAIGNTDHTALKREPILIDLEQMNLPMNPPLADTVRVLSPVSLTGLQLINLSVGGLLRPLHSFLGCSKSVRNIIPDGLTSCGGRHETSGPIHFRIHVEQPKAYQSLKANRPDLSF